MFSAVSAFSAAHFCSYGRHDVDHLSADRTCLLCSEIAVITLLEVNADIACGFHLKLIESFFCFGNKRLVRHCIFLLYDFDFIFKGFCLDTIMLQTAIYINVNFSQTEGI